MRFNVGVKTQEGFESGFVIVFENGLVLHTKSVLWVGTEEKEKVRQQYEEVIEKLQKAGFELSADVM